MFSAITVGSQRSHVTWLIFKLQPSVGCLFSLPLPPRPNPYSFGPSLVLLSAQVRLTPGLNGSAVLAVPAMSVLTTRGMRGSVVYHTGNGFHYYCRFVDNTRMYMKCVVKPCGGRATMSAKTKLAIDFRPTFLHNHGPDFTYIPKMETRSSIMFRCRNEDTALRVIYDEECSRYVEFLVSILYGWNDYSKRYNNS